jgi:hypothetical protein
MTDESTRHTRSITVRRLVSLLDAVLCGEPPYRETVTMRALLLASSDMEELERLCERELAAQ